MKIDRRAARALRRTREGQRDVAAAALALATAALDGALEQERALAGALERAYDAAAAALRAATSERALTAAAAALPALRAKAEAATATRVAAAAAAARAAGALRDRARDVRRATLLVELAERAHLIAEQRREQRWHDDLGSRGAPELAGRPRP